jgi:growth factor-regulated tyrosine kinase substrate
LVRYLDRDFWEQKEKEKAEAKAYNAVIAPAIKKTATQVASSVAAAAAAVVTSPAAKSNMVVKMASGGNEEDLDEFVTTLRTQVEIFVNRMKSNSSRGRSITNDSSVQTLFMNTMAMHSKLLKHIQDQEDKRVYYEGLQVYIQHVDEHHERSLFSLVDLLCRFPLTTFSKKNKKIFK